MMNELTNARFAATLAPLAAEFHAQITDRSELELVLKVGARRDTATITITNNDTGALAGYAVIGDDAADHVVIYAARTWLRGPLAAMAFKGLFGAAGVMQRPLRIHTDRLKKYAKLLGADTFAGGEDADGLPMGFFVNG